MILYEYPLNERVRTLLRLEHLLRRHGQLMQRNDAVDHHYALLNLFEIMDVASRQDLKTELLKDLERQRQVFLGFSGNPAVSEAMLDNALAELGAAYEGLNQQQGKPGQSLLENEWLMAIRNRATIPGGTCEFDLPAYYAWQHLTPEQRRADIAGWAELFTPLAVAVELSLRLLRDAGVTRKALANAANYQQNLGGRSYQLLRLRIAGEFGVVPEITGHRLMISIRFMRPDAEWKLRPDTTDVAFELALCA